MNNCSSYITGIGADTAEAASSYTTCTTAKNKYNKASGLKSSTTHNIYGVYDMSGGAYDYAMGNVVSKNGTTMMSGYTTYSNAGYTGVIYDDGKYSGYSGSYSYPASKYYDNYSFGTDITQRQRSKLGDAIKEIHNKNNFGWYSDLMAMTRSYSPWQLRGNHYNTTTDTGIFSSTINQGSPTSVVSTRFAITF